VVQAQVMVVENLGMSDLLTVQVDGATALRALLSPDQAWSGRQISLTLPSEMLHWFDSQTGLRVADA
jgi:ABC-type sugar transport system ATPase subunit